MTEKIIQPKSTTDQPNLLFTPDLKPSAVNDFTFLTDEELISGPTPYSNFAVGRITMSGIAIVDQTFNIDGHTFTWKALRINPFEVTIGITKEAAAHNISLAAVDLLTCSVSDNGDGTADVTYLTWGVIGNSIVFTEASTNMVMDGAGYLGGLIPGTGGWEELEHIDITGRGYLSRLTASDLYTWSETISETGYLIQEYRFELYDNTTVASVFLIDWQVFTEYDDLSVSYKYIVSQPFVFFETFQTLLDGHNYTWRMSWAKYRTGSLNTLDGSSLNRNLTIQEIKR